MHAKIQQFSLLLIFSDPSIVNSLVSPCVDGAVRLVKDGSVDPIEGRAEICINNIWGSVCNRGFNAREAEVICKQVNNSFEGTRNCCTNIAYHNNTALSMSRWHCYKERCRNVWARKWPCLCSIHW